NGKTSFMERTPESTLKARVSCESIEVPEYHPFTDLDPVISTRGETCSDSAAPTTSKTPFALKPPCTELIASPLVAVARTTRAPPSFLSSSATFFDWLSM